MVENEPQADGQPNDSQDNQSDMVTREELNQVINSAISSRFRAFEKKLDSMLQSQSQPQETESQESDDVKFNKSEFLKLKKQLDDIKKERDQDRSKLKQSKLDSALQEHLGKLGVQGPMLKHAKASLLHDDLVSFNEYDEIVFKQGQEELPLTQGLGSWVKEEGKGFLPATGAQGSGDRSYSSKPETENKKTLNSDEIAAILTGGSI